MSLVKPALPHVGGAVNAWASTLEYVLVGKDTGADFITRETLYAKKAHGLRQPMTAQQLALKPEGERAWKWEKIHATPALVLNVDDVVIFDNVRYRVMSKLDFSEYGYVEYDILQDFKH